MNSNLHQSLDKLDFIVRIAPKLLSALSEEEISEKPQPNKWSKKEIIGHLIDSATNNHQRFVRAQFEVRPEISYDQNNWNAFSFYQEIESGQLILFWTIYNKQLIEIIKRISPENLKRQVKIEGDLFSLAFLFEDYVAHLEHHLKQIIKY